MDLEIGMGNVIDRTVLVFLAFSVVPVLYSTIIACNTAVNLSLFATFGADKMLTGEISVVFADRIGW